METPSWDSNSDLNYCPDPCNQIGYPILTMPFPLGDDGFPVKKPAFCTTKLHEYKLFEVGFALEPWYKREEPQFKKCCSQNDLEKLKT